MTVIGSVASMPVLRPLVGLDKDEIIQAARKLGTYEVSIIPDEDCCTLFTPKHPATRAGMRQVEAAEAAFPVEALVETAVQEATRRDLRYPVATPSSK